MLRRWFHKFVRVHSHPVTRVVAALCLLAGGLDDLVQAIDGVEGVLDVDTHHGVIVFALQRGTEGLVQFLEGVKQGAEAGHRLDVR